MKWSLTWNAVLTSAIAVVLTGACPHPPSNVNSAKCHPAHLEEPNAPAGVLCNGDNGDCEAVNCAGTFTQVAVAGYCGGLTPASGATFCRENHGSVDLWKKVYSAYCCVDAGCNCGCRLKQKTDPQTGQPMTSLTSDVCECRDL